MDLEPTPADDGAGQAEEGFVNVVADLPADAQPPEPVQQRDGLLHHVPVHAQARTVRRATAGDDRADALGLDLGPVLVVVVAAVSEHLPRPLPGPPAAPAHRRDRVDQRDELGDVVAVATGQRDRQRDTTAVGDHVMLGACPGAVDRAGPGFGPPFNARTCELSAADLDQSIIPAAFSLASSSSCNCCHTPAWCQSRSRRQQVIPDPYPSSCGKNSHAMPVYSTNKIPHSALRSSRRLRPGYRYRRCTCGNNGSISAHNSSLTSHGLR